MSLKQKLISTATLAIAVGAFGTFAAAQETPAQDGSIQQERSERRGRLGGFGKEGRGDKHGGGDKIMLRSLGKLDLTDTQQAQIKSIFETERAQNQPQMEELRGLAMKKRDGVITADEQSRFKELRIERKAAGDRLRDSITAILTVEQRAQLDQMKEKMREKRRERRQNRQNQTNQSLPPTSEI